MAENLKTTEYNDGTAIPNITDNTEWAALSTPAYCWYGNDEIVNKNTYGGLYNWFAVNTNKLCPKSWHVPTDDEWTTLTDYLTNNGYGYEGSGNDIAKSMASTSGWTTHGLVGTVGNDQASNNSSGFTALPSGLRSDNGTFYFIGWDGVWWSSSEFSPLNVANRNMTYTNSIISRDFGNGQTGFSVRCLRD